MCNPYAIAMVVAGTALQMNAQSRRQAAMKDAAADARAMEAGRQDTLRNERESTLLDAQQGMDVDAQNQSLEAAAAKREATYAPAAVEPATDYNASTDNGAPKIVMEDAAAKRGTAREEAGAIGNARARLGSYSDVNLGNRISNSNFANQLGMLGGFARGSAALLPGEVASAMASKEGTGRNQELIGTALQMYGSAGAPGVGGAAAAGGAGAAGGMGSYGATMGGSSTAGATVGGYSGNLAGFVPAAGAAGQVAADAAAPGLMGGIFANGVGNTAGVWGNAGRAFGALAPTAVQQRRNATRGRS
jgi:hypothetical protein